MLFPWANHLSIIKIFQMKIFYGLILLLTTTLVLANKNYDKVYVSNSRALCLDGSQAAYYISMGDPKKVLMFLEGGALCGNFDLPSTIQSCYQRSKTNLGSSTAYPQSISYSTGILSNDGDNYFANFTRVVLKYCDGSAHQGSRPEPLLYKGAKLYFRGHDNTIFTFEDLNAKLGIFKGHVNELVISGESIGGLAAFQWTNYIQERVVSPTRFRSIPDSGICLDYPNINTHIQQRKVFFQNIQKLANEQIGSPIPECNKDHPTELWKCYFVQYILPYVTQTPIFFSQSLYDQYYLTNYVGVDCILGTSINSCPAMQREVMEDYREKTLNVFLGVLGLNNKNGGWAIACSNHCYLANSKYSSQNYRVPQKSEFSLIQAVSNWMEDQPINHRHIDFGSWPINKPCSALGLTEDLIEE